MTVAGVQAWVTSAVEEKIVKKAIVLALSLRKVNTAKKLIVLTTLAVSKEQREKLKEVFDLVVLLEHDCPNGLSLEDYAKVQGFSLLLFNKCVYLSPDTLILKNCDEIFEKYTNFAACGNENAVDTNVYVFTPSLSGSKSLEKVVHHYISGERGGFLRHFNFWIQNNSPEVEKLDEKYNQTIGLTKAFKGMKADASIVNFSGVHPLDQHDLKQMNELGSFEKFAVDSCMHIYMEHLNRDEAIPGTLQINSSCSNEPIAICGMSFRLPGGDTADEFWNLLVQGQDAIKPVPPFRWLREHTTSLCRNRKVEAGFLNSKIDEYDFRFFGISPKEAEYLDPQQRMLHEVTWEAFEDGGYDPTTLIGSKTGVFVGSWLHDYKDISTKRQDVDFFRVYMGNSLASEAARLSHFLGLTGPSLATETGCSSSIVAVHLACQSLRNHESNLALACGVNLLLHPFDHNMMSFVVSPNGRCKTFDAKADGFGRGEACAALVLKRLSDVKPEDKVWGLIRGSAITQEGVSKSLGTPTVHCEALAMQQALEDGGVHPKNVSYIETHGTGTPVGDPLEVAAITKAYSKGRTDPLVIGSVKTNVGHTESVSGITGIIKVLLSMKHETIPPHLNFQNLNPEINLDAIPAKIPLSPIPWPKQKNKPRIAGVSSFGISGTDGHVIIQEPPYSNFPTPKLKFDQERPLHIMKISAKCQESLDELLKKYQGLLENTENSFADIAYSANTGRATFNQRAAIIAKDAKEASKLIKEGSIKLGDAQPSEKKLCFLFTGQGSQYPKMASSLYSASPIFKDAFDKCSDVLEKRFNISIQDIVWGYNDGTELNRTLYSQTSIFCVEYCLLKLWESWGVKPDYVMGHSLGEFAAAVAAGALDFEDALMLVAERTRLIDSLTHGKMLVIKADKRTVDSLISKYKKTNPKFWVDYAAINSAEQTVVAGDSSHIEHFHNFCGEKSLKSIVLAATHAFHSRHMDPMLETYRKVCKTVKSQPIQEGAPKYISGVDGKLIETENINADYWVRHTREKVSFMDACRTAHGEGCSLFLEVGPHPVLSALTMMNTENVICLPSLRRSQDDWSTILESLSSLYLNGQPIDWSGFDRFYDRCRVTIPFYSFNRKPVWIKIRHPPDVLHPLIGKLLPNASKQSIFENEVTFKNASFAPDHIVGSTVVFPAAGYLEMSVAAGFCTVHGFVEEMQLPRRPMMLRDLKIKAPLALSPETRLCVLQTVVSLLEDSDESSEVGYSVDIFRHDTDSDATGGQWIPHASSKFFPVLQKLPSEISQAFDIPTWTTSWEKFDNAKFYERLPDVGLRFGPKFQSIEGGWKNEKGLLLSLKKTPKEDHENYLIHPVLGDALIQGAMLWMNRDKKIKKKLNLPIQVGEFILLKSKPPNYIFCSNDNRGTAYCVLLDNQGEALAYMGSVEFAETTVKLIEGMIEQQLNTAMPHLWEEIWKSVPGPMQHRLDPVIDLCHISLPNSDTATRLKQLNQIAEEEHNFYNNICRFTHLYLLEALYKLGWKPEVGVPFTIEDLIPTLGLQESFFGYIRFFFISFSLPDMIDMKIEATTNKHTFTFKKTPPTSEEIVEYMEKTVTSYYHGRAEYKIISEIGPNLHLIISGKADALSYLFPNDSNKPNAGQFYDSMRLQIQEVLNLSISTFCIPTLQEALKNFNNRNKNGEKGVVRILEVGAGTGVFTRIILPLLLENNLDFEYCYTDISAAFFGPVEKEFAEQAKKFTFRRFNMEEDPFQQGFCAEYFDLICCCEVLHVAKDVKNTLGNLRPLLKPNGFIQIVETVQEDPRITFIFGLLEGYWQFQDFDLRPYHATLTVNKWKVALEATGFTRVNGVPVYEDVHGFIIASANEQISEIIHSENESQKGQNPSWLIFSDDSELAATLNERLTTVRRNVITVKQPKCCTEQATRELMKSSFEVEDLEGVLYLWGLTTDNKDRDQTEISLPFVNLCQQLITLDNKLPRVYVVTHAVYCVDGSQVLDPSPATLSGILKAVLNEYTLLNIIHLDLSPDEPPIKQVGEVFSNLWVDKNEIVAFRGERRLCSRFASLKVSNDCLSLPNGTDRFQLILPKTRLISDLEFGFLDHYEIDGNFIEVQTKAMALNFRDVFTVLKPIPLFENLNTVGLDYSGVVTKVGPIVKEVKVGDRVLGMNFDKNLGLPSHIKTEEKFVTPLSPEMTFAEAATLPAVFSTSVYSLINVAKMKRGEKILLHTASGGVGLCAIQIAQQIGANIIATAGSKRKRTYLRNLGIQHVFNSRTTEFEKQILEVTNGRGVDIVLNSITGPGFKEASLGALAKNGRFIEMSKLNVWSEDEVKKMRPDVFYRVVDLTSLEETEFEKLVQLMKEKMKTGFVRPIAYERFDAVNIRGALNYLQKAKHIGKIVCVMPEIKKENAKITFTTPLFNEESTYLVTGGLGGIGFEVVKWMLNNGAKHIAIASRSQPYPELEKQIESWNKSGKHVQAFAVDVGNYEQCRRLFEDLKSSTFGFPKLRGVMHAAGVLQDATLENQTWSKFLLTYNPKVNGSWNLHDLTKNMLLEHFVLFSSIAAIIGSPGQTNHSASNSFEDALAMHRKSLGLPSTVVNWGNWGEVGVATEIDFPGIRPISTTQGLLALETFLKTQRAHAAVLNMESCGLMAKLFPKIKSYIDDKRLLGETKSSVIFSSDEFWSQIENSETRVEKLQVFKKFIKSTIKNVLKLDEDEEIDDNTELQVLGIDSLMMLEMKNGIQNILGSRMTITAAQLKDCTTTELLATKLVHIMEGDAEDIKVLPTLEELRVLIREDSTLPEHIQVPDGITAKNVEAIENVLLTGVTGNLGPYLLRELSHRASIKKVYCLIRKSGKDTAIERLTHRLESVNLINEIDMKKVECIQGDLTDNQFGLSDDDYSTLAGSVDAVVHSAVRADHNARYWKAPETKRMHLRNVNILGLRRLLEFAVDKVLKHFYYASTLLTVTRATEEGSLAEEYEDVNSFDEIAALNLGYPLSKHISEQLMKHASERGIPCKTFRFPAIAGDSKTGRCDFKMNHFILRWLAYMKLGCMPHMPMPLYLLPVDHCAQASLEVFLNPKAPSDVYNVCQKDTGMDQTLIEVARELNIHVEPVPYTDFVAALAGETTENSPLEIFKKTYIDERRNVVENFSIPFTKSLEKYVEDSTNFFKTQKFQQFVPSGTFEATKDVMRRDLLFLKNTGVFEKFGIKSNVIM